jgi:prepilin-type N-terminal cleavage/methylation domain-containing protein
MHVALLRRLRGERGFTLVELLIAMSLGLVVSTGAMALVIVSIHFSSSNQDSIDANQQGRLTMQRIVQALNSSCVSPTTPPILAGSTATSVTFYSSLLDSSNINPNKVTIAYTNEGTYFSLIMSTYPWASGSGPSTWTFSTTPAPSSGFTLLKYVTQATINGTAGQPVFQYYGYGSGGAMSTTPYAVPLSAVNAATTAMVTIQFLALPSDNYATNSRGADFQNSIVLRLTPAAGGSSASNTPCA